MAWNNILKPHHEGGLGIRDINLFQVSLAVKRVWTIMHGDSLWSQYARQRFIKSSLFDCSKPFRAGMPLGVFQKAKDLILNNSRWLVGDRNKIDFWKDNWVGNGPLMNKLQQNDSRSF